MSIGSQRRERAQSALERALGACEIPVTSNGILSARLGSVDLFAKALEIYSAKNIERNESNDLFFATSIKLGREGGYQMINLVLPQVLTDSFSTKFAGNYAIPARRNKYE